MGRPVDEGLRDFPFRRGLVLKELNESRAWWKIVELRRMVPAERAEPVYQECDETSSLIESSRRTAEGNLKRQRMGKKGLTMMRRPKLGSGPF
jgi:hypothetical protein